MVEHSSANPKVPGSIPGPVRFRARSHTRVMDYDEACIMHLTPGVVHNCIGFLSPMHIKDPRFLFKKRRGQPWEFWSLVSTKDGSTLPQVCVEEQLC